MNANRPDLNTYRVGWKPGKYAGRQRQHYLFFAFTARDVTTPPAKGFAESGTQFISEDAPKKWQFSTHKKTEADKARAALERNGFQWEHA